MFEDCYCATTGLDCCGCSPACEHRRKKQTDSVIAWDDVKPVPVATERSVETNVLCPKCGKRLYKLTGITLACFPPKYYYECHNCGFKGCNY